MECKNTRGIIGPKLLQIFGAKNQTYSENPSTDDSPADLGGPLARTPRYGPFPRQPWVGQSPKVPRFLGTGRFNRLDCVVQLSSVAQKPGRWRYTRRSPVVYPPEFSQGGSLHFSNFGLNLMLTNPFVNQLSST
ncbi:hypothetical protein BHE74_00042670 [Ensete ventricosum]|nr:hypothetical protein BHE74_00042670 [Ensete ventricosum]RZS14879.1 hypothetical protein BHM03_00046628 [Ensete ventricosum]